MVFLGEIRFPHSTGPPTPAPLALPFLFRVADERWDPSAVNTQSSTAAPDPDNGNQQQESLKLLMSIAFFT